MVTARKELNLQELFDSIRNMNEPITGTTISKWYEKRKLAKEKFRLLFNKANLQKLTREEFLTFLYFENNQSWTGLYRRGTETANDMPKLKNAIACLQNDSMDIKTRINEVLDGRYSIRGMGKNLATAILHVCDELDRYGVWNNKVEETLERLGLLPRLTSNRGDCYVRINEALNELKRELGTDLIYVDVLMYMVPEFLRSEVSEKGEKKEAEGVSVSLERDLVNFLATNTSLIETGLQLKENEYSTNVGRLDLLCIDRDDNFVVIETKKGKESDKVVGQISRYMGWVRRSLAQNSQQVRGIIITNEPDEQLNYAVAAHENIKLKYYKVRFELLDHF